jgi:hypothetical protein
VDWTTIHDEDHQPNRTMTTFEKAKFRDCQSIVMGFYFLFHRSNKCVNASRQFESSWKACVVDTYIYKVLNLSFLLQQSRTEDERFDTFNKGVSSKYNGQ